MNLLRLSLNNIKRRPFRSGLVVFSVVLVVITAIWTILILQDIQKNLSSSLIGMQRMGADIVVVPRSSDYAYSQKGNIEFARLLTDITAIPGVSGLSPQLRLFKFENSPYSSSPIIFINAFDQGTDFTVKPWLETEPVNPLDYAEAYAGSLVTIPPGDEIIELAGTDLKLIGHLKPTDTTIDQSLYVSFETAAILANSFQSQIEIIAGLESVYTPIVMVDVSPDADPQKVANQILLDIQGVTAFESIKFFQAGRDKLMGMLDNLPIIFAFVWILSELFIGIVFSISVNERRRELGVLRVLGSTRGFLPLSIVIEGLIIGLTGGVIGIIANGLIGIFFLESITQALQLTLTSTSLLMYVGLALMCIAVAVTSVAIASVYPTWLVSHQDPAVALRG